MPIAVRQILPTPNPNALKFLLDQKVSDATLSFFDAAHAAAHPLASKLMAVAGVNNVMLLGDFLTIGKHPQSRWPDIKKQVLEILAQA